MSSHEELDQQWRAAVERDDERDLRMAARLTPEEFTLGAERMSQWPQKWKDDILRLPENERRTVMLLAALLDASPETEEAPT